MRIAAALQSRRIAVRATAAACALAAAALAAAVEPLGAAGAPDPVGMPDAADLPDTAGLPDKAGLPDAATLEAAGARIGTITVRSLPIFDTRRPEEDKRIFHLANRLKISTRDSAIRSQLLFAPGELFRQRLLEESERNLRTLHFLREPHVRVNGWHDGLVDIDVCFQNVWTLQLGPSFGRSGGVNHSSVQLEDSDLFGFGKKLKLGYSSSIDRTSWYAEWVDPALLGGHWRSSLHWERTSDGHNDWASIERPFYALDVRRSYGMSWADSSLLTNRYRLGLLDDQYRQRSHGVDLHLGWSHGLSGGSVQRLTVGWRVQVDRFSVDPSLPTLQPLPTDRDFRFPYLRWSLQTNHFHTARNLDQIERTEDLRFGASASVQVGALQRSWQSDRSGLLLGSQFDYGWDLSPAVKVYAGAAYDARLERGELRDARAVGNLSWYRRASSRWLSFARVQLHAGERLDLDHLYTLGGDSGLRGYPLRYQVGTGGALLRLEQRLYTRWSVFQLFDIGGAAFVDVGRTWGDNVTGVPQLGWLSDAGLGLRLGNRRSSLGSIFHIDIATPLRRTANARGVQLLVATQESY